jgi:hypothetical protein
MFVLLQTVSFRLTYVQVMPWDSFCNDGRYLRLGKSYNCEEYGGTLSIMVKQKLSLACDCLNSNLSLIYLYYLYRDVSFGLDKDDQLSSTHW